jgi:putative addiction module killer protein
VLFEIFTYETLSKKEPFIEWLYSLDTSVSGRVLARVERLRRGLAGNAKALKSGVFEMKVKRPQFRIYYAMIGEQIILLLSGCDKTKQSEDIARAKDFFSEYQRRSEKNGGQKRL